MSNDHGFVGDKFIISYVRNWINKYEHFKEIVLLKT